MKPAYLPSLKTLIQSYRRPLMGALVAVLLGTGLGGETLSKIEWLALGVIVFAVVLVTLGYCWWCG